MQNNENSILEQENDLISNKDNQVQTIQVKKKKKEAETIDSHIEKLVSKRVKEINPKGKISPEQRKEIKKEIKEEYNKQAKESSIQEKEEIRKNLLEETLEMKNYIILNDAVMKIIAKDKLSRASKERGKEVGVGIFDAKERKDIYNEEISRLRLENPDGIIKLEGDVLEAIINDRYMNSKKAIIQMAIGIGLDEKETEELEAIKLAIIKSVETEDEIKIVRQLKKKEEKRKENELKPSRKKETRREREERLGIEFIPFTSLEKTQLIEEHKRLIKSVSVGYPNLRIDSDEKYDICMMYFVKALDYYNNNPVLHEDTEKTAAKFTTVAKKFMDNAMISSFRKEKKTICSLQDTTSGMEDADGVSRQEDRVHDDTIPSMDVHITNEYILDCLNNAIRLLPKPEQIVLNAFFGLGGFPRVKQKEIAEHLNISTSEVTILRDQAIKIVKKELLKRGITKLDAIIK